MSLGMIQNHVNKIITKNAVAISCSPWIYAHKNAYKTRTKRCFFLMRRMHSKKHMQSAKPQDYALVINRLEKMRHNMYRVETSHNLPDTGTCLAALIQASPRCPRIADLTTLSYYYNLLQSITIYSPVWMLPRFSRKKPHTTWSWRLVTEIFAAVQISHSWSQGSQKPMIHTKMNQFCDQ